MSEGESGKSSFIIGWNERTSPYKFEVKVYLKEDQTLDDMRKEAQKILREAMSSEGLV